ncbi:MAG: DUF4065 domain-containing protein [Thermoplasmata archaeon]|jgi:uncharacterized phage-associated protein|nr:DUF4065 domain-containing protein [Thermoplasmata archaeon]
MGVAEARDVASYLVTKFREVGKPATNIKLQKVLYYAWIDYYNTQKKYLFDDEFFAWKFGPVVREVYFTYRLCAAMPIMYPIGEYNEVDSSLKVFLDGEVEKFKDTKASTLVSRSHGDYTNKETAWSIIHKDAGDRLDKVIPFDLIIQKECEEYA